MKFTAGFQKVASGAGFFGNHKALDYAGLGVLAAAPAYHAYQGVKNWSNPDKEKRHEARANVGLGATELGGLGLLAKAVHANK
jgi:hypothetical protein